MVDSIIVYRVGGRRRSRRRRRTIRGEVRISVMAFVFTEKEGEEDVGGDIVCAKLLGEFRVKYR